MKYLIRGQKVNSLIFFILSIFTTYSFAGGAIGTNKLISGNDEFCRVFLDYANMKIDANTQLLTRFRDFVGNNKLVTPPKTKYLIQSLAAFDFDNDGILDQVFDLNGAGSYIAGDIYFVKFGNKNDSPHNEEYLVSEMSIFPCEFNKKITSTNECEPFGSKGGTTNTAIEFPYLSNTINFRNRYTEITPLGFNNKTYLLLNSTSDESTLYNAVIEPTPGKSFKPICLFKADEWRGY